MGEREPFLLTIQRTPAFFPDGIVPLAFGRIQFGLFVSQILAGIRSAHVFAHVFSLFLHFFGFVSPVGTVRRCGCS